jgi:LuxR family maltose regulon positive regulatory protein
VIPALVDTLAAGSPCSLVLDDYHEASSPEVDDAVELFVSVMPATCRLVIATRHDPLVVRARWRASADFLEIRQGALRFSDDEADAWFSERFGLELRRASVEALVARTEGWPAGLYLSTVSLRDEVDPDRAVRTIAATPRAMIDYLSEETLPMWPERLRGLMRRAAPLRRFSSALLAVAAGWADADADLRDLERRNLMLTPLDDAGTWYRLHQLLAEVLLAELREEDPGAERRILSAAASWHAARGEHVDAISYALVAEDRDLVAALINAAWIRLSLDGQDDLIRAWIDHLPSAVVDSDARLLVTRAWIAVRRGEWALAERSLDRALTLGQRGPLPDSTPSVEAAAAIIRGAHPYLDTSVMRANAGSIETLVPADSPWRSHGQLGLAMAAYYDGELGEARRRLRAVIDDVSFPSLKVSALAALAMWSVDDGDLGDARWALDRAETCQREHDLEDDWLTVLVHTARGELGRAAGRTVEVLDAFERGAVALGNVYSPDHMEAVFRLLRARIEVGRIEGIGERIDEFTGMCAAWGLIGQRYRAMLPTPLGRPDGAGSSLDVLTSAELRVFEKLVSTHLTQPEIAAELFLSLNTVKSHVRSIYAKLGASTREEAVRAAGFGG